MTTRFLESLVLDRLITAQLKVTRAGTRSYLFDSETTNDTPRAGQWRVPDMSTGILLVGDKDLDGVPLPEEITTPLAGVTLAWDAASPSTLELTGYEALSNVFGDSTGLRLTFGSALPSAGNVVSLGLPIAGGVEHVEERKVWAARRDYLGRDLTRVTDDAVYTIGDALFYVRDVPGQSWEPNSTFTDDRGKKRTVEGIAYDVGGRGRFIELLSRRVG